MKVLVIFTLFFNIQNIQAKQSIHPIVTTQGGYVIDTNQQTQTQHNKVVRSADQVIEAGAIHVAAQQCPDGGFGWPHNNCDNTFHNITAPIIDGVRQAFNLQGNIGYLGVMQAAGDFDLTYQFDNGEARFGASTTYMLWHLTQATGNSSYFDFAENGFFAALEAGTYSPSDWNTSDWITAIETSRTGTWVNLRPWEFSSSVLIAQRHCRDTQSGEFEQAILNGLNTLDNTDPNNVFSDNIGMIGGLLGLARINRLSFPAINAPLHSGVNGIDTLAGLANYLISQQNSDGSFYWHSNLATPTDGDKDTQSTAYAVMALIKAQERIPGKDYFPAIELAKAFLTSMQTADGGFASFPGDTEHNTEVEGEALSALGTVGVYDRIFQSGLECYIN